jgi:hypothetical protein
MELDAAAIPGVAILIEELTKAPASIEALKAGAEGH